jgi:amino acid permease
MVYREPEGIGSVASTCFVAVSNIIGGGALLLPNALHDASIIPGVIALVLMCALAFLSVFYMILCCQKTRRFSYLGLLSLAISPRFAKAYEVVLFLYTYLILVGWARIIIDSMPPVAEDFFKAAAGSALASEWFWLLVAAAIFFPFTSMKALAHLTWTSVAGFLTILFLLVVMVVRLAQGSRASLQKSDRENAVEAFCFTVAFAQTNWANESSAECHFRRGLNLVEQSPRKENSNKVRDSSRRDSPFSWFFFVLIAASAHTPLVPVQQLAHDLVSTHTRARAKRHI